MKFKYAIVLIVILTIFSAENELCAGTYSKIDSYSESGFEFPLIPSQWKVIESPAKFDRVETSRPLGDSLHEILSVKAVAGTRLMGLMGVNIEGSNNLVAMGAFALVVMSLRPDTSFDDLNNNFFRKAISSTIGASPRTLDSNIIQFHGREWGVATNAIATKIESSQTGREVSGDGTIDAKVYWTLVEPKLIILLSKSYTSASDEVDRQVEQFVNSFHQV
jgi:hypothetical protein